MTTAQARSSASPSLSSAKKDYILLAVALFVALAHGLLYVFLVPPWQHNDEPTHFEYVWMLAHDKKNDYFGDQNFRRVVLKSMIENNFYRGMSAPDPNAPGVVSLGFPQDTERSLYYQTASVAARAVSDKPVATQLLSVRMLSLLIYLLTVAVAWAAARAITQSDSALRWMIPLALALLPGFANLMTAVSDDVLGVFAFTLFLWAASLLMMRGINTPRLLFALWAAVFAAMVKVVGAFTFPLLAGAVLFAVFRLRWRWAPWAFLAMGFVAAMVITLRFGDSGLWLRETNQSADTRCSAPECAAVIGQSVFRLTGLPGEPPPALYQTMTSGLTSRLRGRVITLGAWIWACKGDVSGCAPDGTQKFEADSPSLRDRYLQQDANIQLAISSKPQFYAFTMTVPTATTAPYGLHLAPVGKSPPSPITFFYDGVVLADGAFPVDRPPVFYDDDASAGTWGGARFVNLARNASAETSEPTVRHTINTLVTRYESYDPPRSVLWSLLDGQGGGWYYAIARQHLLETFWARFGWEHVPLRNPDVYKALTLLTVLGLAGGVWGGLRRLKTPVGGVIALMGLAFALFWFISITRGAHISLVTTAWIPGARYTFPVILASVLFLTAGWREWLRLPILKRPHNSRLEFVIFCGFFSFLAVYGLFSMVTFYQK